LCQLSQVKRNKRRPFPLALRIDSWTVRMTAMTQSVEMTLLMTMKTSTTLSTVALQQQRYGIFCKFLVAPVWLNKGKGVELWAFDSNLYSELNEIVYYFSFRVSRMDMLSF
jgi:hypothetical protein